MTPPPQYRGILVPDRPNPDLLALIESVGAIAIWPSAGGWIDTAGGLLT
jgi:hypothetical protein